MLRDTSDTFVSCSSGPVHTKPSLLAAVFRSPDIGSPTRNLTKSLYLLQEEKRRQKEREDEMNRNIAYLSLLEKHEKAMKNRNLKATHEQFVSIL